MGGGHTQGQSAGQAIFTEARIGQLMQSFLFLASYDIQGEGARA